MSNKKHILSLSVSRSDLGRMAPLYKLLDNDESIDLSLVSAGAHGMKCFGDSRQYFTDLELNVSYSFAHEDEENPAEISFAIMHAIYDLLKEKSVDYLLILGDRFEMLAAAQAALLAGVPILHVGGGHLTAGAIDEQCRHAITKLANRHYVASSEHLKRLRQMGENNESVVLTGAPDIDALLAVDKIDREGLFNDLGLDPKRNFTLVTIHPETHSQRVDYRSCFEFLKELKQQVLITAPCQDEGSQEIFELIDEFKRENPEQFIYHAQLGQKRYVNAMRHCEFMLGNSSSGIIESASIPVRVINVGSRQQGRQRAGNVIDSSWGKTEMKQAYDLTIYDDKVFAMSNPYGDGQACEKIYQDIKTLPKKMNTAKTFISIPVDSPREEW